MTANDCITITEQHIPEAFSITYDGMVALWEEEKRN
jgi:hypothetical protein